MHRCARQTGFTLFELMATLAIAGIGLSLAVPSLRNIVADNQQTTAINELVATLHLARSAAITRNEPVALCPSSSGSSCDDGDWEDGWVYFTDTDRNRQVSAEEVILGTSPGIANLEIKSAEFDSILIYRPSGHLLVDSQAELRGEFIFCDPRGAEFTSRLVIHVTGKPRLDNRDLDPSASPCEAV